MTAKELAVILNGREIGGEIFPGEERDAKAAGLVVVYGYSDDTMDLRGSIHDEVDCYDGGIAYLTKDGILREPDQFCNSDKCPYFAAAKNNAKTIKAVWHDKGGPCWTFATSISHETFTIFEDGEPFCEGMVFSMGDLEVTV